jgi:hypothetical protein
MGAPPRAMPTICRALLAQRGKTNCFTVGNHLRDLLLAPQLQSRGHSIAETAGRS